MNWLEKTHLESAASELRFAQIKKELTDAIRERENIKNINLKSVEIVRNGQNEIIFLDFQFETSE